eukprot:TRINITY_DN2124_c0_g1_i3.p1 TRINITY_DN2124_c0_g1~~TRINITY_DN2124_c0_g1_i3.p1  ORF type:complete len:231 (-),score=75.38 TRINITY_DN2124_c0_g1_i3:56-748(-)
MRAWVYRPAFIAGANPTGACNSDDMFCRILASLAELSIAPDSLNAVKVDAVPVDHVGDCIAHIALTAGIGGGGGGGEGVDVNICGSLVSFKDLVDAMIAFGYPVKTVPFREWEAAVLKTVVQPKPTAAAPLVPLLESMSSVAAAASGAVGMSGARENARRLCGGAVPALATAAVDCAVITKMIAHLVNKSLIKAPPGYECKKHRWAGRRMAFVVALVVVLAVVIGFLFKS